MIASLLVIGLLSAAPAHAASNQGLSTYVSRVLERSQAAMDALQSDSAQWDVWTAWQWVQNGVSGVTATREKEVTRTDEEDNFHTVSPCLTVELRLLLLQMESVRLRLQKAQEGGESLSILRLRDLYEFLTNRLKALQWGGTLPGYEDKDWSTPQSFDTPDMVKSILNEHLCPFDSDLANMSANGEWGCTPDTMGTALGKMDQLAQKIGVDASSVSKLKESVQQEQTAVRDLWKKVFPQSDSSDLSQYHHVVDGCTDHWPRNTYQTWLSGQFYAPAGRRFSSLSRLMWNVELLRPSTFLAGSGSLNILGLSFLNPALNQQTRTYMWQLTRDDAFVRSAVVEENGVVEAFAPLQKVVKDFSTLAHDNSEGGLRYYTQNFLYLLRRSCMSRTCNALLEHLLSVNGADSCFPFTNYDGPPPDKNKVEEWMKECKNEAKVPFL